MIAEKKNHWKGSRHVILIILLLVVVTSSTWLAALPNPIVLLTNLKPFSLDGFHRLLVLAPHCDDETLATGGLIQAALQAGVNVRVVVATNGDGYYFATMQEFRKIYPNPQDYIRFGKLRQQESLAALSLLGIKPENVSFLSYPDRGSPSLWNDHWYASNPYRSPFSMDTRSPYPLTYNPNSVYSGEDYLADLISVMESYKPDLVVYPHPDDVHPDHWGLNVFTRLAITLINNRHPSFVPIELTYLVHRPDFPEIKGLKPRASLTPPAAIYSLDPDWYQFPLSSAETNMKGRAVLAYQSQLPLLRNLMESFVRSNEIFAPSTDRKLSKATIGNPMEPVTWMDPTGKPIQPVQLDPVADFTTRSLFPAGDLTAVYAAVDGQENINICLQVRAVTVPEVVYILRIKILSTEGVTSYEARTGPASARWGSVKRSGVYACTVISILNFDTPWALYVGATTKSAGSIMDETGWQMIYIEPHQ